MNDGISTAFDRQLVLKSAGINVFRETFKAITIAAYGKLNFYRDQWYLIFAAAIRRNRVRVEEIKKKKETKLRESLGSCVDDEARKTAAEKRRAIFLFVASSPSLLHLVLLLPGKRRGEGARGKSPSLVNFRLKFLPFRE